MAGLDPATQCVHVRAREKLISGVRDESAAASPSAALIARRLGGRLKGRP
jgi:hypothetical protein